MVGYQQSQTPLACLLLAVQMLSFPLHVGTKVPLSSLNIYSVASTATGYASTIGVTQPTALTFLFIAAAERQHHQHQGGAGLWPMQCRRPVVPGSHCARGIRTSPYQPSLHAVFHHCAHSPRLSKCDRMLIVLLVDDHWNKFGPLVTLCNAKPPIRVAVALFVTQTVRPPAGEVS